MAEKSETVKHESNPQPVTDGAERREEIRDALRRLREIGEALPAVDAVAIVREGRDSTDQDPRR
jgi:hypothetical protein